jgi:hypothetical protein
MQKHHFETDDIKQIDKVIVYMYTNNSFTDAFY